MSFGLIGIRFCIVIGVLLSAFYVTAQLRGIGELKEGIRVRDASIAQLSTGQQDLRTEIKALSAAVSKRDKNNAGVVAAIQGLRTQSKEFKNACDDEPLDRGYVERLRDAAAIATGATTSVSGSAGQLPRTDAGATD